MTDLDAIRAILAPLDITPLFQVPAGDLLRGLGGREPEVAVSGVHVAALTASLGAGRRAPVLELELLDRGMAVRVRSVSPHRFAEALFAGHPDRIEEIHAFEALSAEEELADLRARTAGVLTRAAVRRFHARAAEALELARRDLRKEARALLAAARWCLSGLRLAREGVVTPLLPDLVEWSGEDWLGELSEGSGRRTLAGNPGRVGFYLSETAHLLDRLDAAIDESILPEGPADPGPLNAWAGSLSERWA
jgi:hypothetical protein